MYRAPEILETYQNFPIGPAQDIWVFIYYFLNIFLRLLDVYFSIFALKYIHLKIVLNFE